MNLIDLKDLSPSMLTDFVLQLGLPNYRAGQIFAWLYKHGVTDFAEMTNLKKEIRQLLADKAWISSLQPQTIETSKDGTIKIAFQLDDQALIESVLIPEGDRATLCISTQVGCAMGCAFCLTGTMGFSRNLRPAEIINQVLAVKKILATQIVTPEENQEIHEKTGLNNLVFMGMGEPLLNLDNLIIALDILLDQRGLDFSERRITVSTCGIVPKMRELGERTAAVNLAVSLHSVDDSLRSQLMPVNKTYPVDTLLAACRAYPLPPRRRIMFEYILIDGVNDSAEDAKKLVKKLRGIRCKINLLPFNESKNMLYKCPPQARIDTFQQILWDAGFTVLVRTSRGADIGAACGQLVVRPGTKTTGDCSSISDNG
ncbi:MAG: 23S rRNA (adenine(2503)-C(2))-methyltransferase [Deltaproteobacteria bacterium RIFOXYD12_FULL_50_9]|nr:MAG: 23S rRNA (adenine(2503)-C(2))-methyltransferase [Deltaproteobacteria bacterium RIFOXYD12_FULL_50_9]